MAADQQEVARAGGADQRPRVPALALGPLAGGAHLRLPVGDQLVYGLHAGELHARHQLDLHVGCHPQHVGLLVVFEEPAQLGAAAVHLVAADEVASPCFCWPVSSNAPTTKPRRRTRRAAASSPPAANRRTTLIAARVSQTARFNNRSVRSGVRSPTCCAIVHPLRVGRSLASADTYLSACCQVWVRAKHGRSRPSRSSRARSTRRAATLAAAAARDSVVFTHT